MLEGADEWAVFMDPRAFARPLVYTPAGGGPVPVHGILTAPHAGIAAGGFPGLSTTAPVAVLALSDLPGDPVAGDLITESGNVWRVADVQPDGTGMVRLILERA